MSDVLSLASLEARPRRLAGFPLSLILHVLLLTPILAGAWLAVGAIDEPPRLPAETGFFVPLALLTPRAAAAPPRAGDLRPRQEAKRHPPVPREQLPEMIQPEVVPDSIAEPAPSRESGEGPSDPEGEEGGIDGGVPGGKIGGIPGGDPNGVPGGSPDGVPGGTGLVENDSPLYVTGEVRPPERTYGVEPEYPESARIARLQGKVILEVIVGRDGSVEGVRVLRSIPLLDAAAVEAVRQWRYRPALQGGRPVKVFMTIVVDFKLN
jgi:protein TonB